MVKQKVQEEQLTEYEKKYRALKMREEVKKTAERTRKQMDKEWARYQEAKKQGEVKDKEANEALKMWRFFKRMHELAQRFQTMLERIQSVDELFQILQGTQEIFHAILGQKNDKVTRNMKKDLRLFKKKLANYEAQMDELLDYIDSIFDEKPNAFVQFWNWLTRKPQKTPSDVLKANEAKYQAEMQAYQNEKAEGAVEDGNTTPNDGGNSDDFGAF
jgi:hypothetical protein